MAKSKKKAAAPKKATKKVSAKKKAASTKSKQVKKVLKKAVANKKASAKKATSKKVVAKKTTPTKTTTKKIAPKKVVAKKAAPAKKEIAPKAVIKKEVKKTVIDKKFVKKETIKAAPKKPIEPPKVLRVPAAPTGRPIVAVVPKPNTDDRSKYSEEELKEFEALINTKLDKAKMEFRILKETLNKTNDEGTDSTSGGNTKVLEDGADTAEKENLSQLAARQQKFIVNLENALIRIKNGTYGICSVTGKLISKERLMAVPHTTQSIEAKIMQQD
jgi:RNA polymerase-binding transcription factor DksA